MGYLLHCTHNRDLLGAAFRAYAGKHSMFRTTPQRALLVLLIGLCAGFNIYAPLSQRAVHPTEWYFWTANGSEIDIRQPNAKMIVGKNAVPTAAAMPSAYREWERQCELSGAIWRGVELCNTERYVGAEFESRNAYFKSAVDADYSKYSSVVTERQIMATATALAIWLLALGLFWIGNWIVAPYRAGSRNR